MMLRFLMAAMIMLAAAGAKAEPAKPPINSSCEQKLAYNMQVMTGIADTAAEKILLGDFRGLKAFLEDKLKPNVPIYDPGNKCLGEKLYSSRENYLLRANQFHIMEALETANLAVKVWWLTERMKADQDVSPNDYEDAEHANYSLECKFDKEAMVSREQARNQGLLQQEVFRRDLASASVSSKCAFGRLAGHPEAEKYYPQILASLKVFQHDESPKLLAAEAGKEVCYSKHDKEACETLREKAAQKSAVYASGAAYSGAADKGGLPDARRVAGTLTFPPGAPLKSVVGSFTMGQANGQVTIERADGLICSGGASFNLPIGEWSCRQGKEGAPMRGLALRGAVTYKAADGTQGQMSIPSPLDRFAPAAPPPPAPKAEAPVKIAYANGGSYEGAVTPTGVPSGPGVLTFPPGSAAQSISGKFKAGYADGKVTVRLDGLACEGEMSDGWIVGEAWECKPAGGGPVVKGAAVRASPDSAPKLRLAMPDGTKDFAF